jgi:hypothetical protein
VGKIVGPKVVGRNVGATVLGCVGRNEVGWEDGKPVPFRGICKNKLGVAAAIAADVNVILLAFPTLFNAAATTATAAAFFIRTEVPNFCKI